MSGLDDPENVMWYHLGRAAMLNDLARNYFNECGDRFKRGEDTLAHYLRDLADTLNNKAREERKTAEGFEKKMKEEKSD